MKVDLLLLIVAYHPSKSEVERLNACLSLLPYNIQYGVVVNDYIEGEPISQLFSNSLYYRINYNNVGYGKAVNQLFDAAPFIPPYIGVLNTDLSWIGNIFNPMIEYLSAHEDINLLVPKILNKDGGIEYLCKQNPTLLALVSRRFIPKALKPNLLRRYDRWYTMQEYDYNTIFDVPYLSGCCMIFRSSAFKDISGFDERYFLYLEDADITRSIAINGRCIHFPFSSVVHNWGRGNYRDLKLLIVNLVSAWQYFFKWGVSLW